MLSLTLAMWSVNNNSDNDNDNDNNNTGIYEVAFPKVTKRLNMKQNKTYSEQNTLKQAVSKWLPLFKTF